MIWRFFPYFVVSLLLECGLRCLLNILHNRIAAINFNWIFLKVESWLYEARLKVNAFN